MTTGGGLWEVHHGRESDSSSYSATSTSLPTIVLRVDTGGVDPRCPDVEVCPQPTTSDPTRRERSGSRDTDPVSSASLLK